MQKRFLPGVAVYSLDRSAIIERLRAAACDLAQRFPEIEEVRLFGSLARGDAGPGSDADILVVLTETDLPFRERGSRYWFPNCGLGVDVFVYSRDELCRIANERPRFHRAITDEAILLSEP